MECYYGEATMSVQDCINEAQEWYGVFMDNPSKAWAAELYAEWLLLGSLLAFHKPTPKFYRGWVPQYDMTKEVIK